VGRGSVDQDSVDKGLVGKRPAVKDSGQASLPRLHSKIQPSRRNSRVHIPRVSGQLKSPASFAGLQVKPETLKRKA
jgi:hypothetical protein